MEMRKEKEKFSKADKINLRFNCFNLLIVILSIGISIWAIVSNERIAQKSGAFEKGELRLALGGYDLSTHLEKDIDVYYGVSDTSLHYAAFPIVVCNSGEKTVEDIELILNYPHDTLYPYNGLYTAIQDSIINCESIIENVNRKLQIDGEDELVSYPIKSINPKLSVSIEEIFSVDKSLIGAYQISWMNGNIPKRGKVFYSEPATINVILTAKNMPIKTLQFNINFRSGNDLTKLAQQVIKEKIDANKSSATRKAFYIVVPKVGKVYKKFGFNNTYMDVDWSNTFYCEFDKKENSLRIIKDDDIQKINF